MNFDLFNAVLVPAAFLSGIFGIVLAVWIWLSRPGATPGPMRTDPVVARNIARYDLGPLEPPRRSVDGRRRDMVRAM